MGSPEALSTSKRAAILQRLQDLPSLPEVVIKVLDATDRETTTACDIERLVSSDAALSAKILRVVNSAYYGLSGQVSSLGQAVVILGMHQIRNLVLSISALSLLKGRTAQLRAQQQQFWIHSFGTAAAAQSIARIKRFGAREAELAYTAGLLHDIGKLFLFTVNTEEYLRVIAHAGTTGCGVDEAEQFVLGVRHEEIGFELAKAWHFPEALALLIGRHEGPFDGDPIPMLYAVHAADRITDDLYYEAGATAARPIDPAVGLWLAMSEAQVAELRRETDARIKEVASLYGLIVE